MSWLRSRLSLSRATLGYDVVMAHARGLPRRPRAVSALCRARLGPGSCDQLLSSLGKEPWRQEARGEQRQRGGCVCFCPVVCPPEKWAGSMSVPKTGALKITQFHVILIQEVGPAYRLIDGGSVFGLDLQRWLLYRLELLWGMLGAAAQ